MKIRTDFVTNSSSSSFVVEVEIESDDSRIVFETKPTDEGANSNFKCTGKDIAEAGSVDELCTLLQKSMSGTGKSKIKGFVKDIQKNINDISDISSVTLRRIWISYGESSGCTVENDSELHNLAVKVQKAEGDQKDAACKELEDYLENAEIYAYGGWHDEWPTGFCKSSAKPKYKWSHMGISIEDLAKKITSDKLSNDDLAVETIMIDMKNRTVSESADFIIDGSEKGIEKKKAKMSNSLFKNLLEKTCTNASIKSNIPITDLIPDCHETCDSIDYAVYKDDEFVMAVLIKNPENARSKSFKAIEPICKKASLNLLVLDERKDNTEVKIISRINTVFYSKKYEKYVLNQQFDDTHEETVPDIGTGYEVQVKFADNRAYLYHCFTDIKAGDIVYVGGAKTGCPGMVIYVSDKKIERDEPSQGIYCVEKVIRN